MKILLISVNTEMIRNMPVLPLGMACVAAATQKAGHEVKMVNLTEQQDFRAVLKKAVKGFDPEIIGISVRNIDDQVMESPKFFLEPVKTLVAECRGLSDSPIILGGAGYSIFPKSTLTYTGADMGIHGEGEAAFVMLLDRLERKADLSDVPGLWLPETGLQKKAVFPRNLDSYPSPLPNVHLIPPAPDPSDSEDFELWIPFQTRRGCPMNCSYCSTAAIQGRKVRRHSVEQSVELLSQYAEAGLDHFFFVDNTFNFPPSHAKALCDGIIEAGLNISWRAILYPRNVDAELIEKMAAAGCIDVALGAESGSEEMLRNFNKKFSPRDVREISEMLMSQGISRVGFLLLGGPGETKETVEKSLDFTDSLNLELVKITMGIRIYPDTALCRTAVSEGRITADESLLFPKFYMVRELEDWLRKTVAERMEGRPNWIL